MSEADFPTPWNPKINTAHDTLTGKWSVTVNFGMGFPWISTKMADPFRVASSGPIFDSEESALEAAEFIGDALEVLLAEASDTDPATVGEDQG